MTTKIADYDWKSPEHVAEEAQRLRTLATWQQRHGQPVASLLFYNEAWLLEHGLPLLTEDKSRS